MRTRLLLMVFIISNIMFSQVNVGFSAEFVSKYIWRGFNLADKPSIQPSLDLGMEDFPLSLNVWASFALSDRDLTKAADELDFTLDYSMSLGVASVSFGGIVYTFPNASDANTYEVYAAASLDEAPLAPSLSVYYDLDLVKALYVEAGISKSIAFLTLGANLAYNGDKSAYSHTDFYAGADFDLSSVTISPRLVFSLVSEETVNKDNEFFFGLAVSF